MERPWLVWSNEHGAFWRPNESGYTARIEEAGRYSKAQAEAICKDASPRAWSTSPNDVPPEICMPAPEALDDQFASPPGGTIRSGVDDVRGGDSGNPPAPDSPPHHHVFEFPKDCKLEVRGVMHVHYTNGETAVLTGESITIDADETIACYVDDKTGRLTYIRTGRMKEEPVTRRVKIRATIDYEIDVPTTMTGEQIEADPTVIDSLEDIAADYGLHDYTKFEYLGEVE